MIPINPNWTSIAIELQRRFGSDDKVCDELSKQGVVVNRLVLTHLRAGRHKSPRFTAAAAILNLHSSR